MNSKSTDSIESNLFKIYLWALSFLKPYIRNTILIIVCGLMLTLIELLIPKFIQYFIDIILPNQDYKLFMYCLIGILFLLIIKFGTSSAKELLERKVSEIAGKDLQESMLRHLRKLGFSYFERTSVGATLSLLNTEVAAVQKLYRYYFPSTIQHFLFSLVSIILMIQMSVELTLVVIPAILLYYTIGPRIERKATITANELVTSQHRLGQKHYESISSLLEIKAYNVWSWDLRKTMSESENFTKLYTKRYWYAFLRGTIRRLSYYIGAIILYIYGFSLIKSNAITVGELVAFLLYYFNAMHRLTTVITLITEQKVLMLQALRLYSFVNLIPEVEEPLNPVPLCNPKGEIYFKNVHFSYNDRNDQILENINMYIKPGERVALVGQSGGGKSSILKLNARFYDPKAGEILLDGIPIKSISLTGNYVHQLTNEVPVVARLIGEEIPDGAQHLLSVILISIIIGKMSPVLLVSVVFFSIAYIYFVKLYDARQKQVSKQVQETKSDLIVHLEEAVSSTREVIGFHRLKWESNIFLNKFGRYYESVMLEGKLLVKQTLTKEPITWGAHLVVLGYGGYSVLKGNLSIGMFVVIYQLTSRLMESFENLYKFAMTLISKIAVMERVRDLVNDESELTGKIEIVEELNSLTFDCVSFTYTEDSKDVLSQISIDFPIGKKIALVGTSGGGKSTIADLLMKFYEPQSGEIYANGILLPDINRESWLSKISIVFQEPYLFPLTVRENLTLGKEVSQEQLENICNLVYIDEYIKSLPQGFDTQIGERGITLSGGQRQRLALARALIINPEILILDEYSSALDVNTELQIQKNLEMIRQGKTTIIIAHRLSTIKNSDVIYVLDKGKIAELGTHNELILNNSVYTGLVNAEMKIS